MECFAGSSAPATVDRFRLVEEVRCAVSPRRFEDDFI